MKPQATAPIDLGREEPMRLVLQRCLDRTKQSTRRLYVVPRDAMAETPPLASLLRSLLDAVERVATHAEAVVDLVAREKKIQELMAPDYAAMRRCPGVNGTCSNGHPVLSPFTFSPSRVARRHGAVAMCRTCAHAPDPYGIMGCADCGAPLSRVTFRPSKVKRRRGKPAKCHHCRAREALARGREALASMTPEQRSEIGRRASRRAQAALTPEQLSNNGRKGAIARWKKP